MTALEMLRVLTPNADTVGTEALQAMIEVAEADFMAENARDDVPEGAQSVIARMAAHRLGQQGAAGLQSESFSGASESYLTDYPADLRRAMHQYRRLRVR